MNQIRTLIGVTLLCLASSGAWANGNAVPKVTLPSMAVTPGSPLAVLNQRAVELLDQKLTLGTEISAAENAFTDALAQLRSTMGRYRSLLETDAAQAKTMLRAAKAGDVNPLVTGAIPMSAMDDPAWDPDERIRLQAHAKKIVSSIDQKTSALAQLQQQLDAVKVEIAKLNAPQPVDKHVDPFSND